ncbi:MAG: DMT family transporter [Betaproteobacteria bacterium]|jgi:drug/metabolite transporter (DMT)-like permease|nr:DMT family transporter [Betaproteobacteria bacterium]MCC6246394.1 DMT family transporter [Rubrivivax sp.]MCL4699560.1 DMT family transporter [Burkholderiaceae bacterium]
MKRRDLAELLGLGAIWGASFLFMRLGAVEFGAVALVFLRVAGAAMLLLPLLALQGQWPALRAHWRPIALVGVVNSALPFLCFAVAAYVLSAGLMGVFNATAPIWTALIAWAWLGERPAALRSLGLALGLAGAIGLAWSRAEVKAGIAGVTPAVGIAACIAATVLYGIGANYSRRRLAGVPPMATAAGSQLSATLVLAVPAWWAWPAAAPTAAAWGSAAALSLVCTGLAYILYFRLIAHTGATNAMTVTFLIPPFAMAWGWLVLGERPAPDMLAGAAVILVGTALAVGMRFRSR